jgi:hypothetical protein
VVLLILDDDNLLLVDPFIEVLKEWFNVHCDTGTSSRSQFMLA